MPLSERELHAAEKQLRRFNKLKDKFIEDLDVIGIKQFAVTRIVGDERYCLSCEKEDDTKQKPCKQG